MIAKTLKIGFVGFGAWGVYKIFVLWLVPFMALALSTGGAGDSKTPPPDPCREHKQIVSKLIEELRKQGGYINYKGGLATLSLEQYPLGEGVLFTSFTSGYNLPTELVALSGAKSGTQLLDAIKWASQNEYFNGGNTYLFRTDSAKWPKCP